MAHNPARDSLSPNRVYAYVETYGGKEKDVVVVVEEDEVESQVEAAAFSTLGKCTEVNDTSQNASHFVIHDMTTTPANTMAHTTCSPRFGLTRSHRPFTLELDDSRGATSVSPSELRHMITQTAAFGATHLSLRIQVIDHTSLQTPLPIKGRKRYPRPSIPPSDNVRHPASLPPTIPQRSQYRQARALMGNQQSHHGSSHRPTAPSASSIEDISTSTDSMIHDPRFRPREQLKRPPVAVLKKKAVGKAPGKLTTTIIEVPRAATAPNLDLVDDEQAWEDEQPEQKEVEVRHKKTLSEPSPALLSQPGSPATMTEELASRPLSAGTTVTGISVQSQDLAPSPARLRISALSPTIPTPSPLPEDSPHQYGLKDFTNTPTPPQDQKQTRRRSNGIDIFNASRTAVLDDDTDTKQEAKNLQSAASFLNGLSNARRRAESQARNRSTSRLEDVSNESSYGYTSASYETAPAYRSTTHLPLEHEQDSPPSRPLTPKLDDLSRTLGHTHKSSGFAYAKPLGLSQLRCYRKHERLIRSGNKLYQVECAVCHKDEPGDYYWSCSWCALRMCEECRFGFRAKGMSALKEKIRDAEIGAQ